MAVELWRNVLDGVVFLSVPVLLYVELYIGHIDYAGFLQKCGFGKREVGLLLVGGLTGIVLGPLGLYGVPLWIHESSLIAIDFGGAIVPVVLSLYLLKIKKLNIPAFLVAVIIIGVITYSVSEFRSPLGIVSEFPYYLFPSFAAIGLALLIYRENLTSGIPFAYSSVTFGVLIGADIVRIPQVLEGMEVIREEMGLPFAAGSIGGAGGMDLVFLAGLMAIGPLLLLAPRALRRSKKTVSPSEAFEGNLKDTLTAAEARLNEGKFDEAYESAVDAVDMKIADVGAKFGINQSPYVTLEMFRVHPYIKNDYWLLVNSQKRPYKTYQDTYAALIAARHIVHELEKVESRLYASNAQRAVAFLIDIAIIAIIMTTLFILVGAAGLYNLTSIMDVFTSIWFIAFIMWLWIAQAVYYTVFETFRGQSPGKRLMGIKVVNKDYEKCDFMDAFTRNVVRFLDLVLFFYLVSLVMMNRNPKRQRFGDIVAQTVVLKV